MQATETSHALLVYLWYNINCVMQSSNANKSLILLCVVTLETKHLATCFGLFIIGNIKLVASLLLTSDIVVCPRYRVEFK